MLDINKLKHFYEGSILEWDDVCKYKTDIPVIETIKRGSKKPTVFMPFMGEFGFFINTYIRFIHYFNCAYKIVCCRPGEEILFPSANDFFYDWNDFQKDQNKLGTIIPHKNKEYIKLKKDIDLKFKNHNIVEIGNEISYRFIQFMPISPIIPFCKKIEVDIVIGPRNRPIDVQRNYPKEKWSKIINHFKDLKIGIIGEKGTSYDFPNIKIKNWEYDRPIDTMISMLQNCKLFIGTDSGTSHVASMCGCPMVIFRKKDWSTNFIPFMKQTNKKICFIQNGWENEKEIINHAEKIIQEGFPLEEKNTTKKICLHIPLHIKNHNHAKMLTEKKNLFKNLRALNVDTIFTIDHKAIDVNLDDIPLIDLTNKKATGIVNPTKRAIDFFNSRYGNDCFIIRTGQDVKIDIEKFYEFIENIKNTNFNDKVIFGDFDYCDDIFDDLKSLGINEEKKIYTFIQGDFICAEIDIWKRYYFELPDNINHYKDDSIFSFLLERDGGCIKKIEKFWDRFAEQKGYFDNFIIKIKNYHRIQHTGGTNIFFSDLKYYMK